MVLIKPSELTPFTTLKVLDFFHRAGLQDGILQVATGLKETGEALVSSLNTKMIFFTGSTNVGKQIAIKCAENLKPVILELGGKDPMIVFKDADLLRAARAAIWGGFFNSGQTCISIERVYIEKSAQSEFIHLLKEEYERMIKSDSTDFPSNAIRFVSLFT